MNSKRIEVTAQDGSNKKVAGDLLLCDDCDCSHFQIYFLDNADCGCPARAQHVQCVRCGTTFCVGKKG